LLLVGLAAVPLCLTAIAAPAEALSGKIREFPVPTASGGAIGITAGPHGNLWFTEGIGNKIGRITPAGTITEYPVPTPNSIPHSITAGLDGNLWFTEINSNQIGHINPTGDHTVTEFPVPATTTSPFGNLFDITAEPHGGSLWFTEGAANKIGNYDNPADSNAQQRPAGSESSAGRCWQLGHHQVMRSPP